MAGRMPGGAGPLILPPSRRVPPGKIAPPALTALSPISLATHLNFLETRSSSRSRGALAALLSAEMTRTVTQRLQLASRESWRGALRVVYK